MLADNRSRVIANRLAELLNYNDGARILLLLRRLDIISDARRSDPDRFSSRRLNDSLRIGIWSQSANAREGEYIRDQLAPESHIEGMWSDAATIAAKGERFRIIWLGESVARGYLLDPFYAPARVLEHLLNTLPSERATEVVDLAKTAQTPKALVRLMQKAVTLQPDAFVVFAGNNFLFDARSKLSSALEAELPLRELNKLAEAALEQIAQEFVDEVARIASRAGVPAIIVIPEFNLRDWASGVDEPPITSPDSNYNWRRHYAAAQCALRRMAFDEADVAANAMIALDGACTSTSLRIRGECCLARGESSAARGFFEAARDAELWKAAAHLLAGERSEFLMPRCYRVVQDALRRKVAEHHLQIVDLPQLFTRLLSWGISDRRVFLDYCHLTVDGIRSAVGAIAQHFACESDVNLHSLESLNRLCMPIDDALIGRAHLEAAIVAACWGQSDELIRHHTTLAASLAPGLAPACLHITEFATRGGTPLYSRASDSIINTSHISRNRVLMLVGRMNSDITDAIVDSFGRIEPQLVKQVHQTRLDCYAYADHIDLLAPAHSTFNYIHPEAGWEDRSSVYKAYTHQSRFVFVFTGKALLEFTMSARLRTRSSPVSIRINETNVVTTDIHRHWTKIHFVAAGQLLREGLNTLTIVWPDDATALDAIRVDGNRFYPLVAEISQLTMHTVLT